MKKIVICLVLFLFALNIYAQDEKPSIVVMDFYYKDISAKDMSTSGASVTKALENTEMFEVITVEDRNTILRIKKFVVEDCIDAECQAKAAKALGVDLYLAGDIGRLANKYIFHMSISNPITGEVVYEGDKIYEDFSTMVDDLKIMTYEICGVDPETMPQDDVVIVEKLVERSLSPKTITSFIVMGTGLATAVLGGIFLLDANNFYFGEFEQSYNYYVGLTDFDADYDDAFLQAELNRQTFLDKLWPGAIISGAGVVTLLTGIVILIIPEAPILSETILEPSATNLSFSINPSGFSLLLKY